MPGVLECRSLKAGLLGALSCSAGLASAVLRWPEEAGDGSTWGSRTHTARSGGQPATGSLGPGCGM